MMSLSLLLIQFFLKIFFLWEHKIGLSWKVLLAVLGEDLLFFSLLLVLFHVIKNNASKWLIYLSSLSWLACNVPVYRVFGTPITIGMVKAFGGAISDSFAENLNLIDGCLIGGIFLLGVLLPLLTKSWSKCFFNPRSIVLLVLVATLLSFLSNSLAKKTEILSLNRSPFFTFFSGFHFNSRKNVEDRDWRKLISSEPHYGGPNLKGLRGQLKGKNLVLIALESTGALYLADTNPSYNGAKAMPFLSSLLQRSLLFQKTYTTYPESILGFFSAQCGRFPAINLRFYPLRQERNLYGKVICDSPAKAFRDLGYSTALLHSGQFSYLGMDRVIAGMGFELAIDAKDLKKYPQNSFGLKDERYLIDRSLEWVDQIQRGKNFFLTLLPVAGHHPYSSPLPHKFGNSSDFEKYQSALFHSDEALKYLFSEFQKRNLLDNTVFIFYGDHSEAFYQHPGNYGHTLFLYEENLWVPLAFYFPEKIPKTIDPRVVSVADVAPTIFDLFGIASASTHQGISLLNQGNKMALFHADYGDRRIGLREEKWKYIFDIESEKDFLFDLDVDPKELKNLAGDNSSRIEVYRKHLMDWAVYQNLLIKGSQ